MKRLFVGMFHVKQPLKILIDTREQQPYTFDGMDVETERKVLKFGDYSVPDFEDVIAVERKSLEDFINSVTHDRDRFMQRVSEFKTFPNACILIEASLPDVFEHGYKSGANPKALIGSAVSIVVDMGVHVQFCGNRSSSQAYTVAYLKRALARFTGVQR